MTMTTIAAAAAWITVAVLPASVASAQRRSRAAAQPTTAPTSPGASTAVDLPFEVMTDRLPNGLTVLSIPWPSPGIIAYYTVVRVGSRDEVEPGHSGFAHLFEHMMFRGTARFPEAVYERTLQSFGADNNAFTQNDMTVYHTTAPSSALERLVELEADRFANLRYSETQFRTETGAVRGEYMKEASDPSMMMWETLSGLAFRQHTYGHTTIGFLRDIETMPTRFEFSKRFFKRFYTPDNCTVVVAGDIDHAKLMELVRRYYGTWTGRRDNPRIKAEPEPTAGAETHLDWEGETPPKMWLGWRIPAFQAGTAASRDQSLRETAALQIVHGMLFSESAKLYQELVVDGQKALELDSWANDFSRDPGLFVVQSTLAQGQEFGGIRDRIQQEMDKLAAGEIDVERVTAVQSHLRYKLLMGLETPDDVAYLATNMIGVTGSLDALPRYLRALATVTPETIKRVAERYLTAGRRFVVTVSTRARTPNAEESMPVESATPRAGGAQ